MSLAEELGEKYLSSGIVPCDGGWELHLSPDNGRQYLMPIFSAAINEAIERCAQEVRYHSCDHHGCGCETLEQDIRSLKSK